MVLQQQQLHRQVTPLARMMTTHQQVLAGHAKPQQQLHQVRSRALVPCSSSCTSTFSSGVCRVPMVLAVLPAVLPALRRQGSRSPVVGCKRRPGFRAQQGVAAGQGRITQDLQGSRMQLLWLALGHQV